MCFGTFDRGRFRPADAALDRLILRLWTYSGLEIAHRSINVPSLRSQERVWMRIFINMCFRTFGLPRNDKFRLSSAHISFQRWHQETIGTSFCRYWQGLYDDIWMNWKDLIGAEKIKTCASEHLVFGLKWCFSWISQQILNRSQQNKRHSSGNLI